MTTSGLRGAVWNRMYRREPSWELGRADPELIAALDTREVPGPRRALDVGCGTGDNAIELARRGFEVTAIDIAERPLERARSKAAAAGVAVDFRGADVTALEGFDASFGLIVDRGLLMSLFGGHARRSYSAAVTRLASPDARVFEFQWVLPEPPAVPSRAWMATKAEGLVLAPDELAARLGSAFVIEVLHRSVEAADDPGMQRLGITRVAKTWYWLTRKPAGVVARG
jgi:SAM-dependent methyltransferase